jgi:hypothetical protein
MSFNLYSSQRGSLGEKGYARISWHNGQLFCLGAKDEGGYGLSFSGDTPENAAEKILYSIGAGTMSVTFDA